MFRIIYNKNMISYLITISERCYNAASKRRKNTSCYGCMEAVAGELHEYWAAMDNDRVLTRDEVKTGQLLEEIQGVDDSRFVWLYDKYIHNTDLDEMADLIIAAATWMHSAKIATEDAEGEGKFNPYRSLDATLASGVMQFMSSQIITTAQVNALRCVVNLKMKYNELRED